MREYGCCCFIIVTAVTGTHTITRPPEWNVKRKCQNSADGGEWNGNAMHNIYIYCVCAKRHCPAICDVNKHGNGCNNNKTASAKCKHGENGACVCARVCVRFRAYYCVYTTIRGRTMPKKIVRSLFCASSIIE